MADDHDGEVFGRNLLFFAGFYGWFLVFGGFKGFGAGIGFVFGAALVGAFVGVGGGVVGPDGVKVGHGVKVDFDGFDELGVFVLFLEFFGFLVGSDSGPGFRGAGGVFFGGVEIGEETGASEEVVRAGVIRLVAPHVG